MRGGLDRGDIRVSPVLGGVDVGENQLPDPELPQLLGAILMNHIAHIADPGFDRFIADLGIALPIGGIQVIPMRHHPDGIDEVLGMEGFFGVQGSAAPIEGERSVPPLPMMRHNGDLYLGPTFILPRKRPPKSRASDSPSPFRSVSQTPFRIPDREMPPAFAAWLGTGARDTMASG